MASPFDRVGAALVPVDELAALAAIRVRSDVSVVVAGSSAWVTWPAGRDDVWQRLLAIPAAQFFEQRDGHWRLLAHSLPRFDVPPTGEAFRLDAIIFPRPIHPEAAPSLDPSPARLRLAPSDRMRPTIAIRATIANLLPWIERAPSAELSRFRAARLGERVILRGERFPAQVDAERFWGNRVWLPIGFRADPELPETAIRAAANVNLGEILLLTANGAETIAENAFCTLTRASARLTARES